jgi:mannan endo-1,4-beta-mannosidase
MMTKTRLFMKILLIGGLFLGASAWALDRARPVPPPQADAIVIEAEDGDFFGVREAADLNGFSGSGYVRFPGTDISSLSFDLDIKRSGDYALRLRLAVLPNSETISQIRLDLDDTLVGSQRLPVNGIFSDMIFNRVVHIEKGEHRLTIGALSGEFYVDRISLESETPELIALTAPRGDLVTADPLPAAQRLYAYLLSQRGKATLAGQQIYSSMTDVDAVFKATGRYPAILGCDLIDYSPSRVSHGTNGVTVPLAIKWWKKGGVVSFNWHWNAPTGLIDKGPSQYWFSGFYTNATTFDFKAALDHPEGEDYKLILRDIDAIALQLKKLDAAGVPVLWRPLHEAAGGWFWWGSKGPEAYIKLYKLLFERLENYHRIKNLIWVWNGEDPAWYPGDEYVDILATDIYPQPHDHATQIDGFMKAQAASSEPKLVAMSENGTLPDLEAVAKQKIEWSWFCTWNGDFAVDKDNAYSEGYTSAKLIRRYYNSDWVITRDELPGFADGNDAGGK